VDMTRGKFSCEFKIKPAKLVAARVSVSQACGGLELAESVAALVA
jgi:hypothetical protein